MEKMTKTLEELASSLDMDVWLVGRPDNINTVDVMARVEIGDTVLKASYRVAREPQKNVLDAHEEIAKQLAYEAQNLFKIEVYKQLKKILSEII